MDGSPAVPSSWGREVGSWLTNTIWPGLANAALDTETVEGLAGRGPRQRQTSTRRLMQGSASRFRSGFVILHPLGSWELGTSGQWARRGDAQSIHQGQEKEDSLGSGCKGREGIGTCVFLRGRVIPSHLFPLLCSFAISGLPTHSTLFSTLFSPDSSLQGAHLLSLFF